MYVDINKIAVFAGENVCQSLIGMHAFTGYERISALLEVRNFEP